MFHQGGLQVLEYFVRKLARLSNAFCVHPLFQVVWVVQVNFPVNVNAPVVILRPRFQRDDKLLDWRSVIDRRSWTTTKIQRARTNLKGRK